MMKLLMCATIFFIYDIIDTIQKVECLNIGQISLLAKIMVYHKIFAKYFTFPELFQVIGKII